MTRIGLYRPIKRHRSGWPSALKRAALKAGLMLPPIIIIAALPMVFDGPQEWSLSGLWLSTLVAIAGLPIVFLAFALTAWLRGEVGRGGE